MAEQGVKMKVNLYLSGNIGIIEEKARFLGLDEEATMVFLRAFWDMRFECEIDNDTGSVSVASIALGKDKFTPDTKDEG